MEEIVIRIKDKSKIKFLKQLLTNFDFVEIKKEKKVTKSASSIFDSAGIWEGRDIDARSLRNKAWTGK